MNSDNESKQGSQYVPQSDANGIRKTFTTPQGIDTSVGKKRGIQPKYPWATIKVGESFDILHSEMKKKSIGPFASRMSKKFGKRFKVTDYPEHNIYLVSCLPMEEKQAIETSSNIVEALEKMERKEEE